MRRLVFCLIASALVAACLGAPLPARAQSNDEKAISALEDHFAAAVNAKDVDAIMKVYVPGNDLFVFDVSVPRQYVGWDAYKKDWRDFLALYRGPVKFTISDLSVMSDGKLAYSHSIQSVSGTGTDGSSMDIVVRVTDVYRKIDGKWLIVQEHISVPIDFSQGKMVPDTMSKP